MVGIWSIINYIFFKMQIWIRARTDLIFLKIPCLLPGGGTAAGCIPGWLRCAENQKFKLSCVLGGHSLHFRNVKFLCSCLWKSDVLSQVSSWDRWACMCLFSQSSWYWIYSSRVQGHDHTSKRMGSDTLVDWLCNLTPPFTLEKTVCVEYFYLDN